jgi:hypothetical protein
MLISSLRHKKCSDKCLYLENHNDRRHQYQSASSHQLISISAVPTSSTRKVASVISYDFTENIDSGQKIIVRLNSLSMSYL